MAQIDYITTGDGAKIRYGVWPSRGRPAAGNVMLLNGRREFMEKYGETISDLNRRGYNVVMFDWRGQGLSTRLLPDRLKGHIDRYRQYLDDLNGIVQRIVPQLEKAPWIMLAHSMGAHIALRFLHDDPQPFGKAVFTSPMIDIQLAPYPAWLARSMVSLAKGLGRTDAVVPGGKTHTGLSLPFEGNRLTSDPVRFQHDQKAIALNPDLALGGPTYGWMAATFESIDMLKQTGYAEKITLPVLMVSAANDRIVCNRTTRTFCARMSGCREIVLKDARHEILMETDAVRNRFWAAFDEFVR